MGQKCSTLLTDPAGDVEKRSSYHASLDRVNICLYVFRKMSLFKKLSFGKVDFQKIFASSNNTLIKISYLPHQKYVDLLLLYFLHSITRLIK